MTRATLRVTTTGAWKSTHAPNKNTQNQFSTWFLSLSSSTTSGYLSRKSPFHITVESGVPRGGPPSSRQLGSHPKMPRPWSIYCADSSTRSASDLHSPPLAFTGFGITRRPFSHPSRNIYALCVGVIQASSLPFLLPARKSRSGNWSIEQKWVPRLPARAVAATPFSDKGVGTSGRGRRQCEARNFHAIPAAPRLPASAAAIPGIPPGPWAQSWGVSGKGKWSNTRLRGCECRHTALGRQNPASPRTPVSDQPATPEL